MTRLAPRAALAVILVALAPSAEAAERIVVVPLENLTRAAGAREAIAPASVRALERAGFEIVAGEEVARWLRERRVRYLDSLPNAEVSELLERFAAGGVLVGSVLAFDRRSDDPRVALSFTLLGPEGRILWSDVRGLASSETRGAFDRGRTSDPAELAARLAARMLAGVPAPLREVGRRRPEGNGPRVFRSRDSFGRPMTVGVLPLQNLSGSRDASRVVEAALQHDLSRRAAVTAITPAELRRLTVAAKLRAPGRLTPDQRQALARAAGTPHFLEGTILAYGTPSGDGTPVVEIYLRLLDVESGRTLWSGLHHRDGGDFERLFGRGVVRDPATLASRTVAELVDAFTEP